MEQILDQHHLQIDKSNVKYGGFWQRVAALLIDGLVLGPVTFGLSYFNITTWKSSLLLVVITIIGLSYKPFMETYYGATLGKMALKLKVTNLELQRATLQEILLRNIFQIVPQIIALFFTVSIYNDAGFESVSGYGEYAVFSQQFKSLQYIQYASVLIFVVDAIVLLADGQKRSLHDKIAGTLVIETQ